MMDQNLFVENSDFFHTAPAFDARVNFNSYEYMEAYSFLLWLQP